jgi:hypothetical protein
MQTVPVSRVLRDDFFEVCEVIVDGSVTLELVVICFDLPAVDDAGWALMLSSTRANGSRAAYW